MVCTANELQEWKDFPKGLRVLLLGEDIDSASDIRSKLEAMDYIVSIFCSEIEAASAFSSKPESFHLAIVEVNTNNGDGTFKFLETAKELPIIMASNTNCLKTMMKCISLGAVEFLRKPLSEDKLKNIWQHVVHKAFNAGGGSNPGNESLALPNPNLKLEEREPDEKVSAGPEIPFEAIEHEVEKYPAPSTPQLSQGVRLTDDGDCQDQNYCCIAEKEDCESKSVETMSGGNSVAEATVSAEQQQTMVVVKEEEEGCIEMPKSSDETSSDRRNSESSRKRHGDIENPSKVSSLSNSSLSKYSRKKMKVDWTPELHKKFVHAVEQLGVDQAIPSRILELMKVEGLTRHNVASHLQKYRMHKRHILPKEDEQRWPRRGDPAVQRHYYPQQPVMAYPTYHSNHTAPLAPVYPMWGQPGGHPASVPMWGLPSYPSWQPAESWHWKSYPTVHADAWGCPVVPPLPPHAPYGSYPQNVPGFPSTSTIDNVGITPQNSFDLQPADEVIDKVVKEAINKPWLPLPLGLKPPSTDSVLSELSRQGISTIPPKLSPS